MKKILAFSLAALLMLSGCSEINDRLDNLEQNVDAIQNTQIATINSQISSINASLTKLEKADGELKDYILTLEERARNSKRI